MARRVFFSFHYDRDIHRASRIRKSNEIQSSDIRDKGFYDGGSWEQLKRQGKQKVKNWINSQLKNTSVTVVLIGAKTHTRCWVEYEIKRSIEKGNGLLGIRVHRMKDLNRKTDTRGRNPLRDHQISTKYGSQSASSYYNTHDWELEGGRRNIGDWIEQAASLAGN